MSVPFPLHLAKVAAGVSDPAAMRAAHAARGDRPSIVPTRNRPTRSEEVVSSGGSLYWIIGGRFRLRRRIVGFRRLVSADGREACGIVLEGDLVEVEPRPKRGFQGWRYLLHEEAPPDLSASHDVEAVLRSMGFWGDGR